MQGPSHLMISCYFGEAIGLDSPRHRRIVAWSGRAPDIDVLAYVAAIVYYRGDQGLAFENVWQVIHHRYTHGLAFILLTGAVAYAMTAREGSAKAFRIALLAMLASAIHDFCDPVAGGPTWPIYPIWPISGVAWSASWSWTIGEWPNILILFACLGGTLLYAKLAERSPLECFGDRANGRLVRTVRHEHVPRGPNSTLMRWLIWG